MTLSLISSSSIRSGEKLGYIERLRSIVRQLERNRVEEATLENETKIILISICRITLVINEFGQGSNIINKT